MVLGKKVTMFDWEWDRNLAPRDGQKIPCTQSLVSLKLATLQSPVYCPINRANVLSINIVNIAKCPERHVH